MIKTEDELKKEISQKEEELSKIKGELFKREYERTRREQGLKIFEKEFKLKYISDSYNVYPSEIYNRIENEFIETFTEGDISGNKELIMELREKYIKDLNADVQRLQEQIKNIENQKV